MDDEEREMAALENWMNNVFDEHNAFPCTIAYFLPMHGIVSDFPMHGTIVSLFHMGTTAAGDNEGGRIFLGSHGWGYTHDNEGQREGGWGHVRA